MRCGSSFQWWLIPPVLLSVFFAGQHAPWVLRHLTENADSLCMSTVNLTETLIHLRDRQPDDFQTAEQLLFAGGIRFVPPDVAQARIAAEARLRFPLNLGDCYAYALAKSEQCSILTLDRDFRSLDCEVLLPDN